jgi:hypothetical protein
MNHKLLVRVHLDEGSVFLDVTGCLISSSCRELMFIIGNVLTRMAEPAITVGLSRAKHVDRCALEQLQRFCSGPGTSFSRRSVAQSYVAVNAPQALPVCPSSFNGPVYEPKPWTAALN